MTRGQSAALSMDELVDIEFSEHRDGPRKVASLPARLSLPDGTAFDGRTTDISHVGIGFVSPRLLPSGQLCELFVDLSARDAIMELHLTGRICYCREQLPGRFRVGLRFVDLAPEVEVLLAAVLG